MSRSSSSSSPSDDSRRYIFGSCITGSCGCVGVVVAATITFIGVVVAALIHTNGLSLPNLPWPTTPLPAAPGIGNDLVPRRMQPPVPPTGSEGRKLPGIPPTAPDPPNGTGDPGGEYHHFPLPELRERVRQAILDNRKDDALRFAQDAVFGYPNEAEAYLIRADAYTEQGDHAAAIDDCDEAIRRRKGYVDAFAKRAYNHNRRQDYREALADSNTALWLNPHCTDAYLDRGDAYLGLNRPDDAIADYTTAISRGCADGYFCRAQCHHNRKHFPEACADYAAYLKLRPGGRYAQVAQARIEAVNFGR